MMAGRYPLTNCFSKFLVSFLFLAYWADGQAQLDFDNGRNTEAYRSLTADGAWCWFSDPRAVYYEGKYRRTYTAWVDSYGDVVVAHYDHDTKAITTNTIYDQFERDDHDNPAILIDKKGYIMVFYSKHSEREGVRLSKSVGPESIEGFERIKYVGRNDDKLIKRYGDRYTYANVVYLSKEDRIYLFWRSTDGKPTYSYSVDGGYNWSIGKVFIDTGRKYSFKRPYVKVTSNGVDKIGFAFTEGHPRKEDANNIYFMYLKEGMFRKADGTAIKPVSAEPVTPDEVDIVFKGEAVESEEDCDCKKKKTAEPKKQESSKEKKEETDKESEEPKKGKGWIWDVAFEGKDEVPVIAYARFPDDENHWYAYARWEGESWYNNDLVNSGGWFPKTPKDKEERERNYSGGLVIDHENPNLLYLSVKRDSVFEIEQWRTDDKGRNWKINPVTKASQKDNIRPFTVRNAKEGNPLQLIWMTNIFYQHYSKYRSALQLNLPFVKNTAISPVNVLNTVRQVADRQIMNPERDSVSTTVDYGIFYMGLQQLHKVAQKERYYNHYKSVGQYVNWRPSNKMFSAGQQAFFQPAIELYKKEKQEEYIDDIKWVMDMHLERTPKEPLTLSADTLVNRYHEEWWTNARSLFLGPPAFVAMSEVTEDEKYLDYATAFWKKTTNVLLETESGLYQEKDAGGKAAKISSSANGYILAALMKMLAAMPEDHAQRDSFKMEFKRLAPKLKQLQAKDGWWKRSLIDGDSEPVDDVNGTAAILWGLSWGVNQKLLDAKAYRNTIEKAWRALITRVNDHGAITTTNTAFADAYRESSPLITSGLYIGAGMEVYKMAQTAP